MRETIAKLNAEAGIEVALSWLDFSERILAGGRTPARLSDCDRDYSRVNLIPERFYAKAAISNKAWHVSDANWRKIRTHALDHARQILVHTDIYPLTKAHFTVSTVPQHG